MMKTFLSRLAPLLLLLALLPACAELPGMSPPSQNMGMAEDSLYRAAEASYRRQAYSQAYHNYAEYLTRFPQGPHAAEARLREAELLGLQGDWQGSLRSYQAILARQPEPQVALKARYGIGWAYFKLGQYQEAGQILDSLTAAGDLPRSLWFSSQMLLGEIALKKNDVTQAFARLRLASQDLASGDHEWFTDLKGRVVEAASPADLENLANLYRDSPVAAAFLLRLARLDQQGGHPQDARKWLKTLVERYPNSPEAATANHLLEGNKITLGCLLPLSGELSNIGFRVQRGMELASHEVPVKLVYKDTQGDPAAAGPLVQALAQDSQVVAIVGPLSSGVAQSAAEAAQQAGVPLLALSQKSDLTQTGNLIFQALLSPKQQVQTLVAGAMGLAIQRYAILCPDSPYGRTFAQLFQDELTNQNLEPAIQVSYAPGTQDFSPTLTSLKQGLQAQVAEGPGTLALFIPDDAGVVATIAGQLANYSLTGVQVLGTNLLHNPGVTAEQLTALQGVLFPDAFFVGDPKDAVQKFITAYRQQYGENPDYLAAQGYAVIRLLGDQAKAGGGPLSRADLPQKLMSVQATPDQPWIKGFNPQREEVPAMYLLTIKENQIQMVNPSR